jgi:hypothetical protein
VLQKQHGVGVRDRGAQHPDGVVRGRRHHHLQAGDVAVEGLDRLRVVEGPVDPPTPRAPHHHGELEVAVGPIPHTSGLRDELVERRMDEVRELDLGNGDQVVEGHTDGQPHDK